MKTSIRKIFGILLLIFTLTGTLGFSQNPSTLICHLDFIDGYENEYRQAKKHLGEATINQIASSKVYVTAGDNNLYIHSNYLAEGFNRPSKLLSNQSDQSFESLLAYMYSQTDYSSASLRTKIKNNVELIIDPQVFSDRKFYNANFSEFKNIKFVCPDETIRTGKVLFGEGNKIDYLIMYNEKIAVRIKNQNLKFIFAYLKKDKIKFKDLKIISLVEDTSTKDFLKSNFSDKTVSFNYSNADDFKSLLLKNKGKRTVILGHVENGSFVTLDAGNRELFRISLDEIQNFQQKNDLELILLGCNAGVNGRNPGPLNKFNSLKALQNLSETKNAANSEEFLNALADGTFQFVLDDTFFKSEIPASTQTDLIPIRYDFSVYEKTSGENSIKYPLLGKVIFAGFNTDVKDDSEEGSSGGIFYFIAISLAAVGGILGIKHLRRRA